MIEAIRLKEATPTGTTESAAFLDYADGRAEFRVETVNTYDRAFGDKVRAARRRSRLYLGTAATRLGIGVVEMSSLENGSLVPATDADAAAILATFRGSHE